MIDFLGKMCYIILAREKKKPKQNFPRKNEKILDTERVRGIIKLQKRKGVVPVMNKIFKTNRKEMCVITECPFCGKTSEVGVNSDDYFDYMDGILLVQEAFPYLSPSDREKFVTGMCDDCQADFFGCDDEDEEDCSSDNDEDDCIDPFGLLESFDDIKF
jgi:hypothetical protein